MTLIRISADCYVVRKRRSFRRYLARLQGIWRNEIVEIANETKMDGDRLTSLGPWVSCAPHTYSKRRALSFSSRVISNWETSLSACVAIDKWRWWLIWWATDISANQNQRCKCALMSILSLVDWKTFARSLASWHRNVKVRDILVN